MTQMIFSLLDPNTLLPHRAGIAGLALALSKLDLNDPPLHWEIGEDSVKLTWDCSDKEAITWIMNQTYQVRDGYLNVPALKLDQQGQYIFTSGVTTTFLQHSQQRSIAKQSTTLSFPIEDGQPEVNLSYRPLQDCYYTRDLKDAFNNKGQFKPSIPVKGHHLPGLVECFINGPYQESPQTFVPLLFLPLVCNYYQLPDYRMAIVIPEISNIQHWIQRRHKLPARTYRDFRSSGAGESGLRFLLHERLVEDIKLLRVRYCEVYQLGKQPWDGNQSYLKQAVLRVNVSDEILDLYHSAYALFPPQVRKTEKGETWISTSKVLHWIADNLVFKRAWHAGFFEFRKANKLYERKGLIKMAQHLTSEERILYDAVQGAFRVYLRGQFQQAQKQGRAPDYSQIINKVIYRFRRPSTQQDFASALVDFLSQFRSAAARGSGAQIFQWLHREANWKQARDLTLLAIATYQAKDKDEASVVAAIENDDPVSEGSESEVYEEAI